VVERTGGKGWHLLGKKAVVTNGRGAIERVRQELGKIAQPMDCYAIFNHTDGGWRVICQGKDYDEGLIHYDFNYLYFLVTPEGQVIQKGYYTKMRDRLGNIGLSGKPMWGKP